jgi:16S rRNA (cytosine967-C5)-methyltransferase
MLYVTCTISKEENEDVVKACLERNKDLVLEDARDHIPEWGLDLVDDHGFLKTFPHIHHMDGFFAALFSKR